MQNSTYTQAALEHYGSWQQLLMMIDSKLSLYLQIPQVFQLMEDGGLHPEKALCPSDPAYFSDAIALRCLNSYDENESDNTALERCMTDQLHENFTRMERADRSILSVQGMHWAQYTADALLRLAWRLRENGAEILFYLSRNDKAGLSDPFALQVSAETALLTRLGSNRAYALSALSFADFSEELRRCFRLATEEDGYYVPEYVWLCADALK